MDKPQEPIPYVMQPNQQGMQQPQIAPPPYTPQTPMIQPIHMVPQHQMPQPIIHIYPQPQIWLGPQPQPFVCPNCQANIITDVKTEPSEKTHLLALIFCFFCCLPCIPYCVDSLQNRNHYCPACRAYLGKYSL